MFKTEAALKAAQILLDQILAAKTELKTLEDKFGADRLHVEDDSENVGDLEKEVIELATETDVLKKSAPEANDESNIQYFLAIAELEKTNGILRQQEIISQDNLKSLDEDIVGAKKDLQELKNLWELKPAILAEKNKENVDNNINQSSDIEKKFRGTRKLYKEFKDFLSDYLKLIDPVDGDSGGHFGQLLQALWTSFQECARENDSDASEDSYVEIKSLEFDVEEEHINLLVNNGIAEFHPENKELIRLVNFNL